VLVDGNVQTTGPPVAPDSSEAGWKDTTPVRPFEIVRVICRFEDYTGKYPYHCHILEHEEHEMMRQFKVLSPTSVAPEATTRGIQLSQSVPNPTTGVTRIAFALSARAAVRMEVEDVAGRRIATLVDQRLAEGGHDVIWNGRLGTGEMAAPGVYFYRLVVDGKLSTTRRLVVLR
jgi:spore coat protein A